MTRSFGNILRLPLPLLAAVLGGLPVAAAGASTDDGTGMRAEVQIGMCSPIDAITRNLKLGPPRASLTVWQFDDPALSLFARGIRLRLRVAANGRSVLTLKVADQDCANIDSRRIPPGEGKCEYDVYGEHAAGAVSLDVGLDAKRTGDLISGRAAPADSLSAAQEAYLRDVEGIWPLPSEIRALGPMQVETYRTKDRRYDIDISRLPGGERFAEISRKVSLGDAPRDMRAMEAELAKAGIEACPDRSSPALAKLRALER
jgi:hypothetical protein